jgi:hypothetical protein
VAKLYYCLAQEFLIFAEARDVSGERFPNVYWAHFVLQ